MTRLRCRLLLWQQVLVKMLRMEHDYKRVPQRPRVKPKSINTDPSALNCVWLHLMMKYICSYWCASRSLEAGDCSKSWCRMPVHGYRSLPGMSCSSTLHLLLVTMGHYSGTSVLTCAEAPGEILQGLHCVVESPLQIPGQKSSFLVSSAVLEIACYNESTEMEPVNIQNHP